MIALKTINHSRCTFEISVTKGTIPSAEGRVCNTLLQGSTQAIKKKKKKCEAGAMSLFHCSATQELYSCELAQVTHAAHPQHRVY